MKSPYEILEIAENASESEIRQARRNLLFDLHSDRMPSDLPDGAKRLIEERVLEINAAYEEIILKRSQDSRQYPTSPSQDSTQAKGTYYRRQPDTPKGSNQDEEKQSWKANDKASTGPASAKSHNPRNGLAVLRDAFRKCSEIGGFPWGLAYLCTLFWADLLLTVVVVFFDNDSLITLSGVIQAGLNLVFFAIAANLLQKKASLDRIWRRVFNVVITSLLSGLLVLIGLAFFVIPGVIAARNYFYAPFIAASECCGPIAAMKKSVKLAGVNGWRASAVWYLLFFATLALASFLVGLLYGLSSQIDIDKVFLSGLVFLIYFGSTYLASIVLTVFGYSMLSEAADTV